MANKLSFDISMNTQGYVAGAQEAEQSNKKLKQSTKEYLDSFGSLKKQMLSAKREAQNLSGAFAQLSKTEKESEIGKQMASELELAIKKAAEFQDIFSDTQERIKREASDTQGWDAMSDAFSIGKDLAIAYAGAVGKLTGNEKALKDMIATVAMVQGGANAAVKIGNALQKQSNVMIAINNIQLKAKAVAEELATKKTIAATAAQKVFNAVAKANPYVLLATTAIAAAAAIGGYMLATQKATKEDEKAKKAAEKLADQRKTLNSTYAKSATELILTYRKLQSEWMNLSSVQSKNEWIKKCQSKFNDLGISVKNVYEAEKVFVRNTSSVVGALLKRAEAAAAGAMAEDILINAMQEEREAVQKANDEWEKSRDEILKKIGTRVTENVPGEGSYSHIYSQAEANRDLEEAINKRSKAMADAKITSFEARQEAEKYLETQRKLNSEFNNSLETKKDTDIKTPETEKEIDPNIKLSQEVGKRLQKDLEKKLKEINTKSAKDFENMKIEMKLTPEAFDLSGIENIKTQIQKTLQPKEEYDFSYLTNSLQASGERGLEELSRLGEGIKLAAEAKNKFMKDGNTEGVRQMDKEINNLTDSYLKQKEALDNLQSKNDSIKQKTEEVQALSEAMQTAGNYISGVGNAFTMLGQALGSEGLQVFGIIAETIANIMLSFSQALVMAATMGPWAWIAFGIQGMAQVAAMIAQIKNLASSSGFEQGGVVPGNSFTGDKMLIRVNSGERVLTAKQNENIEKIASGVVGNGLSSNIIHVEGRISGKDLLLVQKNYNTVSPRGQKITF